MFIVITSKKKFPLGCGIYVYLYVLYSYYILVRINLALCSKSVNSGRRNNVSVVFRCQ